MFVIEALAGSKLSMCSHWYLKWNFKLTDGLKSMLDKGKCMVFIIPYEYIYFTIRPKHGEFRSC